MLYVHYLNKGNGTMKFLKKLMSWLAILPFFVPALYSLSEKEGTNKIPQTEEIPPYINAEVVQVVEKAKHEVFATSPLVVQVRKNGGCIKATKGTILPLSLLECKSLAYDAHRPVVWSRPDLNKPAVVMAPVLYEGEVMVLTDKRWVIMTQAQLDNANMPKGKAVFQKAFAMGLKKTKPDRLLAMD